LVNNLPHRASTLSSLINRNPKHDFFVKASSKSFEESFESAYESIVNQLKRQKQKQAA